MLINQKIYLTFAINNCWINIRLLFIQYGDNIVPYYRVQETIFQCFVPNLQCCIYKKGWIKPILPNNYVLRHIDHSTAKFSIFNPLV